MAGKKPERRVILIRALHGMGKKIGLDHSALTEIALSEYSQRLSGMSEAQLQDFGFWLKKKVELFERENRQKQQWSKQDRKIFKLGFLLGWTTQDLRGYFMREVRKDDLLEMSLEEKNAVIIGLSKTWENRLNASRN